MTDLLLDAMIILLSTGTFCAIFMGITLRPKLKQFVIWTLIIIFVPIAGMILCMIYGPTNYDGRFPLEKEIIGGRADDYFVGVEKDFESQSSHSQYGLMKGFSRFSQASFSSNNDVLIYPDTIDYFEALFRDLEGAREFIHIQTYIFADNGVGNRLATLLKDKVREGVKVRFMCDFVGLDVNSRPFVEEFKSIGGEFVAFHPMTNHTFDPKKNDRNHRKIIIIDGRIGYAGGANFSIDYTGEGLLGKWEDIDFRVTGDSVFQFNIIFARDWEYATSRRIDAQFHKERITDINGKDIIQIITGGRDCDEWTIESSFVDLISTAKRYVWIQTPYLVPTKRLRQALIDAVGSGIDVRIMLPLKSDTNSMNEQNDYSSNVLMKHGVKIYKYGAAFLHSKSMIVDGTHSMVGSPNLDSRSLRFNFEMNVVFYSERLTRELQDIFEKDMEHCTEYSCEDYLNRSFREKARTALAFMFRPLL